MYKYAKSCVKIYNKISDFFWCDMGVRQGENESPVLFAIYLNYLNESMKSTLQGWKNG